MKSLRRDKRFLAACTAAFLGCAGAAAAQTTWHVATNGSDTAHDGRSWAAPYATIGKALTSASGTLRDTILVSNGVYDITAQLAVTKPVTLRGLHGRDATQVRGDRTTFGCFYVSHTNAVLEGLTITNGRAQGNYGGGVSLANGTVHDCLIVGNEGAAGGGVSLSSSAVFALLSNCIVRANMCSTTNAAWARGGGVNYAGGMLVDCVIERNTNFSTSSSYNGGGLAVMTGATNPIVRCDFLDNHTEGPGGGVWMQAPVRLIDCRIEQNYAKSYGGGLYAATRATLIGGSVSSNRTASYYGGGLYSQDLAMTNVTVAWNQMTGGGWAGAGIYVGDGAYAADIDRCDISFNETTNAQHYGGGGICFRGSGKLTLRNSRIVDNRVGSHPDETVGRGGGVYIALAGQANLIESCTIAGNYACTEGGGIWLTGDGEDEVWNSIVYSNRIKTGASNWLLGSVARRENVHHTCTPDAMTGTGNITQDPAFEAPDEGSYRLGAGSPCINAGANRDWMAEALDLDGKPRLDRVSGQVDMGCHEFPIRGVALLIR